MVKTLVITRQGANGLWIKLTPALVRVARLRANQRVHVLARPGEITISPTDAITPTLEQRLARFDPARHGGVVMAFEAIRWE